MKNLAWILWFLLAAPVSAAFAADCGFVTGEWNWVNAGVVRFMENHVVLYNGVPFGTWKCTDPARQGVALHWANGFIDTLNVSGDRVSGKNQVGVVVTGTRKSRPAANAPAPSNSGASATSTQGTMNIMMASGVLQRCLGITPGAARMMRGPGAEQYCRQLPAADLYDQAGVRFKAGDHAAAARILMNAAQAGNARAQLRLALLYEAGDGVPRDLKAAFSWFSRAAAAGEPASQMELGGYYEDGDGVTENWDLAARLYRASATQGWMKGQFALGRAYEFGIGVPQDRQQAINWFQKSAAQGNAQGDYYAGWLRDPTNNIGFRNDTEHDTVIAGKLRFALGPPIPPASHSAVPPNELHG
ncbi:MAG: tetratricopeptide repeat protein [bacterium]